MTEKHEKLYNILSNALEKNFITIGVYNAATQRLAKKEESGFKGRRPAIQCILESIVKKTPQGKFYLVVEDEKKFSAALLDLHTGKILKNQSNVEVYILA